jgi:hypothetical protein
MLGLLRVHLVIELMAMRSDDPYELQFLGYPRIDQDHVDGFLPL